jgi:hypothetical protein
MKIKLILASLLICQSSIGQIPGFFSSKEYSKDISLYKAKAYLMDQILGAPEGTVIFEIDPLAASSSGQLTSLYYNCKKINKEGLILGFYGNYWNEAGVIYQGYGFLNLPTIKAYELLNKISKTIEENVGYLMFGNNNAYFKYDDMTILLYNDAQTKIRIFWKDFDAEWELTAFNRTLKRFDKNVK